MHILLFLLIGLAAGFIGSKLMHVEGIGPGMVGYLIVGVVGALIGGYILGFLGVYTGGLFSRTITAIVGSFIFLAIIKLFR